MEATWWLAPIAGLVLAAACGLRAFLPLLVVGLASRAGLIELHGGSRWLAGDIALATLAIATALEILADKVPVIDHVLDAAGTVVRPAAAWIGAYALLSSWPSPWGQLAAVVLGGTTVAVHALKAKLRLGSSAVTLGVANPLLSLAEDAIALLLAVCALIAPLGLLLATIVLFLSWRRMRRRRASADRGTISGPAGTTPLTPAP